MMLPYSFKFKGGKQPAVSVKCDDSPDNNCCPDSAAEMKLLLKLMKGKTLEISIKVDGKITRTTARHCDKNTNEIILLQFDHGKIVADKKKLDKALNDGGFDNPDTMAKLGIKGFKFEKEMLVLFE